MFYLQVDSAVKSRDFYNPNVDATISLPFSTAAYRLHTFVPGTFNLLDKDFRDSGELDHLDCWESM